MMSSWFARYLDSKHCPHFPVEEMEGRGKVSCPRSYRDQAPHHYVSAPMTASRPKKRLRLSPPSPTEASIKTEPQVRTPSRLSRWMRAPSPGTYNGVVELRGPYRSFFTLSVIATMIPGIPGAGKQAKGIPLGSEERSWPLTVGSNTPRHCLNEPQMCRHQNTIVCKMFVNSSKWNISRSSPIC